MPLGPRLVELLVLTEAHEDLRRGVREVCSCFPNEYWRDLDERRRYPEEFVEAMTEAGYLGALIPEEYGGMGLDLSAGCAILEEVNRSGQCGTCPRPDVHHGHAPQAWLRRAKRRVPAEDSQRRSETAGFRRHRARSRNRHDLHKVNGDARGRPLRGERAQDLHLQGRAVWPHDPACPHHTHRGEGKILQRPLRLPRGP